MFVLIALLIVGVAIALFVKVHNLETAIENLKKRVDEFGTAPKRRAQRATAKTASLKSTISAPPPPPPSVPVQSVSVESEKSYDFSELITKDWPMKLGAVLLLIGLAWFLYYTIDYIGPVTRIVMGIAVGLLFLLLGEWRFGTIRHQAILLVLLGATIILLSIFSGRLYYDFFTPLSATAIMFVVIAYVSISAAIRNSRPMAAVGFLGGAIIPLLTVSEPSFIGLFSYLFALSLGTLWLVYFTGWRILTFLAIATTFVYSIPYISSLETVETNQALLATCIFTILFYGANIVGMFRRVETTTVDMLNALGIGLFFFVWVLGVFPDQYQVPSFLLATLLFAIGAYTVFAVKQKREPMVLYSGIAVFFMATVLWLMLDGAALVISYTVLAAVAVACAAYLAKMGKPVALASALFLAPVLLSLETFSSYERESELFSFDLVALLVFVIIFFLLSVYFRPIQDGESRHLRSATFAGLFFAGGWVYAILILWMFMDIAFPQDTGRMFALVIYTLVGLSYYIYGKLHDKKMEYLFGGVLIALVGAWLLLVEIWGMEIVPRIITLVLIGLLLLGTAIFEKKTHDDESDVTRKK